MLLSTEDGGKSWTPIKTGTTVALWDIAMQGWEGWMVGDLGTILYTKDGGKTWSEYDSGVTQRLNSVTFPSASRGWAVGKGGLILQFGPESAPTPPARQAPAKTNDRAAALLPQKRSH